MCGLPPPRPPPIAASSFTSTSAPTPRVRTSSVTATTIAALPSSKRAASTPMPPVPSWSRKASPNDSSAFMSGTEATSPLTTFTPPTCVDFASSSERPPPPPFIASATRFSSARRSSSSACTFRGSASTGAFSSSADSCSSASRARMCAKAPRAVNASTRRTPAATPVSCTRTKTPTSAVLRTCVPPHNSFENSPTPTTRTVSPYFSLNSAVAPSAIASACAMIRVVTGVPCQTSRLTIDSISRRCAGVTGP